MPEPLASSPASERKTYSAKNYILPGIAGFALIVFAAVSTFMKFEVSAGDIIILIFGATLMSTCIIDNIKFDGTGFQLQTLKEATQKATDALEQQSTAVQKINESLNDLTTLVKESPPASTPAVSDSLQKILTTLSANTPRLAASVELSAHANTLAKTL